MPNAEWDKVVDYVTENVKNGIIMVDTVAASQGVSNALEAGDIKREFYDRVMRVFRDISSLGPVSRRECRYDVLLAELGKVTDKPYQLVGLWKHLGPWLESGIGVATHGLVIF